MIEWLIPAGLFWVVGAVFFGGLYDAETGSGWQQFVGLLLTFVLYMAIFAVLRLALAGPLGLLGRLILPAAIPTIFLGRMGQLVFRVLGVRLVRTPFGADAH